MNRLPFYRTPGLIFACLFPSLLTFFYFVVLADDSANLQKSVYAIGKIIQFTFPLWFLAWVLKAKISFRLKMEKGFWESVLFGLGVGILIVAVVQSPLLPEDTRQLLQANVQAKVTGLGITTVWSFFALGVFYALLHSLLEEYYWRWFVYGQMRKMMKKKWANLLSSLGFMAHHILVLGVFLGWQNPLTYLFSGLIAVGGSFWARQYERSNKSLLGPWFSHLFVDACIFYVGYTLINFQ